MSIRRLSLRICFSLLAVAVSSLLLSSAQAGGKQRGRPIDLSEPRSDEVTTNLHQLTSKKDSLKQLEEDLYTPLQAFSPKSSIDGVPAPPIRPPATSVIQSKRAKELLERRKNWIFMSPEDLLAGPTVDDILKTPRYDANGQEKKELEPMERYYQRLAAKRPGTKNINQTTGDELFGSTKSTNPRDQLDSRDDSNLPSSIKESALALKQLTEPDQGADRSGQSAPHGTFSDTFGLGSMVPTKDQKLAHKTYMDEYHALLDPGWQQPATASPGSPLPDLADTARPTSRPATGLGGLPTPAPHRGLEAQMDVTHPMLGPVGLPDVNAQALGQPRLAPVVPMVESPKVVAPTFTAPRRVF
jgi:hypothetical protein